MAHQQFDGDMLELVQNSIGNLKNDLVTPDEAVAKAESPQEVLISHTYAKYQRMLKAYNAVDFDDLIMGPTILFRDHPEVLTRWQKKIRYLLVVTRSFLRLPMLFCTSSSMSPSPP